MSSSAHDPSSEASAGTPGASEEPASSPESAGTTNASSGDTPAPPPVRGDASGTGVASVGVDDLGEGEEEGNPGESGALVADVLDELERERDHFKDLALRTQAELENFRKQTMKRQTEALSRAAEGLVTELLPVLDAFDAARSHAPDSDEVDALWSSLWGVLSKQGLERIDATDETFDPNLHEAVSTLPATDDHEEGTVATIMRTGYVFKGRVLRAAMVAVRG